MVGILEVVDPILGGTDLALGPAHAGLEAGGVEDAVGVGVGVVDHVVQALELGVLGRVGGRLGRTVGALLLDTQGLLLVVALPPRELVLAHGRHGVGQQAGHGLLVVQALGHAAGGAGHARGVHPRDVVPLVAREGHGGAVGGDDLDLRRVDVLAEAVGRGQGAERQVAGLLALDRGGVLAVAGVHFVVDQLLELGQGERLVHGAVAVVVHAVAADLAGGGGAGGGGGRAGAGGRARGGRGGGAAAAGDGAREGGGGGQGEADGEGQGTDDGVHGVSLGGGGRGCRYRNQPVFWQV